MARGDGAVAIKTGDAELTDEAPRLSTHQQRHLERKRLQAEMVRATAGYAHLVCCACETAFEPKLRRPELPPPRPRWPCAVLRAR
jgi:hypothetical protein